MKVGVGLPNTIPGISGEVLVEWARRADAGPFSTLGVLDRLVYDSIEPFAALAAAAAVTSRIRLATNIAIGPLRSPAMLAKQALSVDALSGGRFALGLGVGARRDDYAAAGADHGRRGATLSSQLAYLRGQLEESGVGPAGSPVELLVGGSSGAALTRMARYADGYAHGGGPPKAFGSAANRARAAWRDLERPGEPKLWGQGYVAFGDPDRGSAYLLDYYAFTGPFAEKIAAGNLTSARAVRDFVRGYEAEGCDELILYPTVGSLDDLDRLAEAVA
ncbi:LLM class flavin-dependent oxidoreductase [Actinophytocola oryzae]|uniref:LLM class flavin-dependent oxidoreductase n=1 Tax=Actinophytocola oryzae TaxID=502181 RepID=UPI00106359E4|nr:LLM class flavin-dependent oxidoreductase [Actinophytocola oryzae]